MRNAEHLDEALLVDCGAASSEAPAEEQVLANGEVRKEPVGLEDEADAARFDGKVDARIVRSEDAAVDADRARCGLHEIRDAAGERRLAAALPRKEGGGVDEDGEVRASPPSGLLGEGGFDFDDALEDAGRQCVESGVTACANGYGEGGEPFGGVRLEEGGGGRRVVLEDQDGEKAELQAEMVFGHAEDACGLKPRVGVGLAALELGERDLVPVEPGGFGKGHRALACAKEESGVLAFELERLGRGGVEHRLERGGVRAEFGCEPCGRAHRLDVIFIGALRLGLEKEGGKRVVDGLTRKVLQLLGDHGLALYI